MKNETKSALSDALNYVMKETNTYPSVGEQEAQKDRILRFYAEHICTPKLSVSEIVDKLNLTLGRGIFSSKVDHTPYVIEINIPFSAYCEHHWLPFSGYVDIGYTAGSHIIGLSKLNRIVALASKGVTTQEDFAGRVKESLDEVFRSGVGVPPIMSMVRVTAKHSCIGCRGVRDLESSTEIIVKGWVEIASMELVRDFTTSFNAAVK